ncbi:predicted protein [Postia placenta Mad-698-R]|nr:predicted protein [Postia placenta Mad-698-R]
MANYSYDEAGNMAAYFLLTFLSIILIPLSLSSLPSRKSPTVSGCQCGQCVKQRENIRKRERGSLFTPKLRRKTIFVIVGWTAVAFLAYKVATTEVENKWKVDDISVLNTDDQNSDDDISEPEEDSLAGQMALMRGGTVKKRHGEESDDESSTDDDQDKNSDGSSSDRHISISNPYLDTNFSVMAARDLDATDSDPKTREIEVELDAPQFPAAPSGPIRLAAPPPRCLRMGMTIRANTIRGSLLKISALSRQTLQYELLVLLTKSTHQLLVPHEDASLRLWEWIHYAACYPWLVEDLEDAVGHTDRCRT